jgi:hypothetical protein
MSDVKSLTCPNGSESTQNGLYCKAGDVITSPAEYAGEHAATCGSNQSSAKGVPGFLIDGKQMKCIREGLAAKGISLPEEYFYFDAMSNIEGYTCYNTTNVATNIGIVEKGMDVVEECVGDKEKAEAFKKFVDLHTPPDVHGTSDWIKLGALFGVIAPLMGIVLQHFYHKWFGPKGPPSDGDGDGGSGSREIEVAPSYGGPREVVTFGDSATFATLAAGAALLLKLASTVGTQLAQFAPSTLAASGASAGGAGGGMAFSALEGTAAVSAGGAGASAGTGAAAAGAGAGTFGAGAFGVAAVVGVLLGAGVYASGLGELIGTTQLGEYIGDQWYEALNGPDYSAPRSRPAGRSKNQAVEECVEEDGYLDQWCD